MLVLLFRSFFKPITILSALPLSLGGAFLGLLVYRHVELIPPSLIGLLMLLGLAAKNSILLVEFAIEDERTGLDRRAALVKACRERARPIVMTTVAMAAGMLPTALGIGTGADFRQPMAVAVIGGLITSTTAVAGAGAGGLRVRRRLRAVAEAQARPHRHAQGRRRRRPDREEEERELLTGGAREPPPASRRGTGASLFARTRIQHF